MMGGRHFKIILSKMFEFVNAEFDEELVLEKDWYKKYSWTQEQEDGFEKWLTDYLCNSSEAREEIIWFPVKSKTSCKRAANAFITNYGWISARE